jgi:hypothetical protein
LDTMSIIKKQHQTTRLNTKLDKSFEYNICISFNPVCAAWQKGCNCQKKKRLEKRKKEEKKENRKKKKHKKDKKKENWKKK